LPLKYRGIIEESASAGNVKMPSCGFSNKEAGLACSLEAALILCPPILGRLSSASNARKLPE
jgi:hypothetical protein